MAIHRVFDSPTDRIVFDTGHQSYVHKLLTGRYAGFARLRQEGGLSGYPSQAESDHDIVENSHASTALSYADGLAKAYAIRGEDRHVVAVIGDGALTGGMAWEALNNIAIAKRQPPGHRGQRQRAVLHADHRRSGDRAHQPAHQPALRAAARRGQEAPQRRPRRRPRGVRRPARHEEGHEGRPRPPGPLRGPRPQVRRPRRRPRPGRDGAGADPGQAVRRAGHRARDHPQGLRLRRRREPRRRPVPLPAALRHRDRRGGPARAHLDRRVRRRDASSSASAARTSSRSPRR